MKTSTILTLIFFCSTATALDLKLKGGAQKIEDNLILDIGIYAVAPLNNKVDLLCGIRHASNPAQNNFNDENDVTSGYCGIEVNLWSSQ